MSVGLSGRAFFIGDIQKIKLTQLQKGLCGPFVEGNLFRRCLSFLIQAVLGLGFDQLSADPFDS